MLIEEHIFRPSKQRIRLELRVRRAGIAFIATLDTMVAHRSRVMRDRKWVSTDALDHVFPFTVLFENLMRVNRWLQLLQFFKKSEVLVSDLLISLLNHLLIQ